MTKPIRNAALLDPAQCVSYRLRRAARMAAKTYDDALRPLGLRNTQFTLLAALNTLGAISIGELAEELATDATTLTRNLDVLIRRGYVENLPMADGRVRAARLTAAGKTVLDEALPVWREVQSMLLDTVSENDWPEIVSALQRIEKASTRAA